MSHYPKTQDKYIGIEIELISNLDEYEIQDIVEEMKLEDIVDVGMDGSIETNMDGYGHELKLLIKQQELKNTLARVQTLLNRINARVNNSCGLHVHIDMRNRKFLDSVKKLLNVQNIMLKSVPKHRINNEYCMPVKREDYGEDMVIGKYHTIHSEECYEDYKTIEVRIHEGTTNMIDVYNWCNFLIKTVDGNFANKPQRTLTNIPIRLKKYLEQRMRGANAG